MLAHCSLGTLMREPVRQSVLGSKVDSGSQVESLPLQTALETKYPPQGDNPLPHVKGGRSLCTTRPTAPCPALGLPAVLVIIC